MRKDNRLQQSVREKATTRVTDVEKKEPSTAKVSLNRAEAINKSSVLDAVVDES